jgi:hypothetical protein
MREEHVAAWAATFVALAMITQQVAGKATRDAFFLLVFDARHLPVVMVASAAASVIVVLGMGRVMQRFSPARVAPVGFALNAAGFVAWWALARVDAAAAATALYLHVTALGGAVVSSFWSVVNERFDPHAARRVVGAIARGATAGGVLGGLLAWRLAGVLDLPAILLVLAALNGGCAIGLGRVGGPRGAAVRPSEMHEHGVGSLAALRRTPYLRTLALLVLLGGAGEATLDYVFKAYAEQRFAPGRDLVTFFALVHTLAGVATFLVQALFTRRALERVGLAGAVAALPGVVVATGLAAVAAPGLVTLTALRGAASVVENSLYRSGYELLYTPLPAATKRAAKALVDVTLARLGTAAGSGLALLTLALALPERGARVLLIAIAMAAAGACLALARRLHHGYVRALADSLRDGSLALALADVRDVTTRRTLSETTGSFDRASLLRDIEALRDARGEGRAPRPSLDLPPNATAPGADGASVTLATLRGSSARAIRAVLDGAAAPLDPALVPAAIALLGRDDVHADAEAALRRVAPRHVGQLIDALLDGEVPAVVRRRVPRVLAACATQRAADGLLDGLADEVFEVRYRCALALARITRDDKALRIPRRVVYAAALREAQRSEREWHEGVLLDPHGVEDSPFATEAAHKVGRSVEYVFTVLSLTLERDALGLALRALASDDDYLRGTGLEFLENVLPERIRHALWPWLGDRRAVRAERRPRGVIADELSRSLDSMRVEDLTKARRTDA